MERSPFTQQQERQIVKNAALRLSEVVPFEDLSEVVCANVPSSIDTLRTRPSLVITQMMDAGDLKYGIDKYLRQDQPFLPGFEIVWTSLDFFKDPNEASISMEDKMEIISNNLSIVKARRAQRKIARFENFYNGKTENKTDPISSAA